MEARESVASRPHTVRISLRFLPPGGVDLPSEPCTLWLVILRLLLPATAALALLFPPASAQEAHRPPASNPGVSTEILILSLGPLTAEEIEKESAACMEALKEIATAIAIAEIRGINGEADADAGNNSCNALRVRCSTARKPSVRSAEPIQSNGN